MNMYVEILKIVKGALNGIRESKSPCVESKDERVINEIVSQALTNGGYSQPVCLCIFLNGGIEGVISNEGIIELKFKYEFERGEFTTD